MLRVAAAPAKTEIVGETRYLAIKEQGSREPRQTASNLSEYVTRVPMEAAVKGVWDGMGWDE